MTGGDWKTALYIFEHKNHPTPAVFFLSGPVLGPATVLQKTVGPG